MQKYFQRCGGRVIGFIKRAAGIVFTNAFGIILAMAAGIIISRALGPERRGYMALVIQGATMIFTFGHLGIGSSITYFTGKKRFSNNRILGFTVIISLVLGTMLAAIFYIFYPKILGIWTDIPKLVMVLGLVAVPFIYFNNFFGRFLMGLLHIKQANILKLIRLLSYFVLVIIFILFLKGGIKEAIICFTASMVIAAILGFLLFSRGAWPLKRVSSEMIKPFFSYGSKLYLGYLFRELNNRMAIFIIKYYLSAGEVSYYQIATNIGERLWLIPTALTHVLLPTLLMMKKGSTKFTAKVCRNNFFLMIILSTLLLIFSKMAVSLLYGEEYARVSTAIYSILWAVTIWPIYNMLAIDFASRNQIWITVITSFIGAVVNIVCNFLFIPRFGIVGAGLAVCVSNTVMVVLILFFFVRRTDVTLREILVPTMEDLKSYRDSAAKGMRRLAKMTWKKEGD